MRACDSSCLADERLLHEQEKEASWFAAFVAGDRAEFLEYVADKRKDGEWGDDPEIQAMCELYDRPAAIYVYDQSLGAKLLRTFHEGGTTSLPAMRCVWACERQACPRLLMRMMFVQAELLWRWSL